jgi:hypothetical protein
MPVPEFVHFFKHGVVGQPILAAGYHRLKPELLILRFFARRDDLWWDRRSFFVVCHFPEADDEKRYRPPY